MIKIVLLVLIVGLLLGLFADFAPVVNMLGTFSQMITTPLKAIVQLLKRLFDIFFVNYYLTVVVAVIVIACVFAFVLSWLTGGRD